MSKKFSVSLAILVAACCVLLATASISMEKRRSYHYCSENLNNVLSTICAEKGFNSMVGKRGSSLMSLDPLDPMQYIEEKESSPLNSAELLAYPRQEQGRMRHIFEENALSSLTATRRRTRQGIVEECCARPCAKSEMMYYCAA